MKPRELAYYLYCLTLSGCELRCATTGVDERQPVLARACGETCAIYSEVELGEFTGESAEANMQDLTWLGPRVCRHEYVIEHIMSQAPVLPARFATLFSSLDSLEQFLVEHRVAIAGFFTELGEKQEWAVKGLLDRAGALRGLISSRGGRTGWLSWHSLLSGAADQGPVGAGVQPTAESVQSARGSGLATHAGGFRERKVRTPMARGNQSPRSS